MHVNHIEKNKDNLILRSKIIRLIREFFWFKDFLEVETPNIVKVSGQEPYLSPMGLKIHNERDEEFNCYLHTSPEYTMKKMLAAGMTNIFSICKCYRDCESFGGTHNPEFTMLEWYRTDVDMFSIVEDLKCLFQYIAKNLKKNNELRIMNHGSFFSNWMQISMKDLWNKYVEVNLDDYLDQKSMFELCVEKKYNVDKDESYEDLFYRIFLNEIELYLGKDRPVIVYNYPAPMAALSKLSYDDPRYAERFEVYVGGLELANAFSELADAKEQKKRLEEEQDLRKKLGKEIYDIDENFIDAVGRMPKCAGIALGIDRLVQVFTGCKNIDDVLALPMSKLFE